MNFKSEWGEQKTDSGIVHLITTKHECIDKAQASNIKNRHKNKPNNQHYYKRKTIDTIQNKKNRCKTNDTKQSQNDTIHLQNDTLSYIMRGYHCDICFHFAFCFQLDFLTLQLNLLLENLCQSSCLLLMSPFFSFRFVLFCLAIDEINYKQTRYRYHRGAGGTQYDTAVTDTTAVVGARGNLDCRNAGQLTIGKLQTIVLCCCTCCCTCC